MTAFEICDRFFDHELNDRVEDAKEKLQADLKAIRDSVIARHEDEIAELRRAHREIRRIFDQRIKPHGERVSSLLKRIVNELDSHAPDLDDYPIPGAEEGQEIGEPLFDSSRNYFTQLAVYKKFQGRAT